ncbi:hypothetical protein CQY20_25910 [Mycolicibacterium agri]|uniref:Uncharacterized protein n=1 Tax=Mycolicibacterium agri TaxID=36811 RepID=A0A2A7MRC5_MYCAG|nr:hypothetical protein CQY20_25910 [Mycolicibacterium agri]
MAIFTWHEIGDTPASPGVYAWYYTPEITAFDLENIINEIEELLKLGESSAAKAVVKAFLEKRVFQYFEEQPYEAQLRGPLKPRYEGRIHHVPVLSDSMLERILEDPRRLVTIRSVLAASAPEFASPIYIGMSDCLRVRLRRHKSLIEKFGEISGPQPQEGTQRDYTFAREIRARKIPPSRLFVITRIINDAPGTYIDIENILNRIHCPLLGRN